MTALSDAEQAVARARARLLLVTGFGRLADPEPAINALIAAVRHHDAETVRDEGTRYDDREYSRSDASRLFAIRIDPKEGQ